MCFCVSLSVSVFLFHHPMGVAGLHPKQDQPSGYATSYLPWSVSTEQSVTNMLYPKCAGLGKSH